MARYNFNQNQQYQDRFPPEACYGEQFLSDPRFEFNSPDRPPRFIENNYKKLSPMEKLNIIEQLADSLISTEKEARVATEIISAISKKMLSYKVLNLPPSVQSALSKTLDSGDLNHLQNLQAANSSENTNMSSGSYSVSSSTEIGKRTAVSPGLNIAASQIGASSSNIARHSSGTSAMNWGGNSGTSSVEASRISGGISGMNWASQTGTSLSSYNPNVQSYDYNNRGMQSNQSSSYSYQQQSGGYSSQYGY